MYNKSSSETRSGYNMIIYVDIDGTICYNKDSEYENSTPRWKQIYKINKLYDEGNEIVYWTARGGHSGIDWSRFTKRQIDEWGCKYTRIEKQKKPSYDLFICDKTKRIEEIYRDIKLNQQYVKGVKFQKVGVKNLS